MNYLVPDTYEDIIALGDKPIDEDLIAAAIAGVIKIARSQGQSLDDLTAEVLEDDPLLDPIQRTWLRDIVTQAWETV